MTEVVNLLTSMATRLSLADLAAEAPAHIGVDVRVRSIGGVEAASLVRQNEGGDLVVLAADAMAALDADGHLMSGTVRPLFRSQVAVASAPRRPRWRIDTADGLRQSLRQATAVAYSTGPSGVAVQALLREWGIWDEVAGKLVQASPGVAVGSLLLEGQADLGFQQFSELMDVDGIEVLGPMPPGAEITTVFSGGVLASCTQARVSQSVLEELCAAWAEPVVRRRGMELVTSSRGFGASS